MCDCGQTYIDQIIKEKVQECVAELSDTEVRSASPIEISLERLVVESVLSMRIDLFDIHVGCQSTQII